MLERYCQGLLHAALPANYCGKISFVGICIAHAHRASREVAFAGVCDQRRVPQSKQIQICAQPHNTVEQRIEFEVHLVEKTSCVSFFQQHKLSRRKPILLQPTRPSSIDVSKRMPVEAGSNIFDWVIKLLGMMSSMPTECGGLVSDYASPLGWPCCAV